MHGELAAFLRSRRARLSPADVGLPADSEPGRRRTPNAASIYDIHFDYQAWNEPYRRIRHDPAGAGDRHSDWGSHE